MKCLLAIIALTLSFNTAAQPQDTVTPVNGTSGSSAVDAVMSILKVGATYDISGTMPDGWKFHQYLKIEKIEKYQIEAPSHLSTPDHRHAELRFHFLDRFAKMVRSSWNSAEKMLSSDANEVGS